MTESTTMAAPPERPPARVGRALLAVQAVLVGLATLGLLMWTVFEEPFNPPTPIGRDFRADEAATVAALAALMLLSVVAWWRLRHGRPRLAIALSAVTLLLTIPALFIGPELAWLVAAQVGIAISAWRARGLEASGAADRAGLGHLLRSPAGLIVVAVTVLAVVVAVVGLSVGGPEPVPAFAEVRAGPDGDEDRTFGDDGIVRLAVTDGTHEVLDAVATPDGGLVVLGRADGGAGRIGFVLRLDGEGRPVDDFGIGGVATLGRWAPSRVAADGQQVVAVGGAVDVVAFWREGRPGADGTTELIEVPVPDGDVAVGVPISDVVLHEDGTVTVAGGIEVNREDEVGGCCAIEPDSIPFRLHLTASGTVDPDVGVNGFELEEMRDGEGHTAGPLAGGAPRTRIPSGDRTPSTAVVDFTPSVLVEVVGAGQGAVGTTEERRFVVVARPGVG